MKVLVTDGLDTKAVEFLYSEGFDVECKGLTEDELIEQIADYDALIVRSATKVTSRVLASGALEHGKLKLVGRAGIGVDNIDTEAAGKCGVVVKFAPHGSTESTAEHTIGLMLAVSRNIPQSYRALADGQWKKKDFRGSELFGKTVGIMGCGRIGKRVAAIAQHGFGMDVLGFDTVHDDESGITYTEKQALLGDSDYVSLHLPRQPEPVIGREEISLMKRSGYLINASRGGNVDERALYEALINMDIAGAAMDVYETEGRDGKGFSNMLFGLPNFIGTPHLGASTAEGQKKTGMEMARSVAAYLKEGDFEGAVNAEDGAEKTDSSETYNVFVCHEDKPGVFSQVTRAFGEYGINIRGMPSGVLQGDRAVTIIRAEGRPNDAILKGLGRIEGIYSVRV